MAYTNQTLIARSKSVFVKEETTTGTLAYPSASDYIILTDYPSLEQQQVTTQVSSVRSSRSRDEVIFDHFSYGTFSGMTISSRPSGTAGTSPTTGEKTLLKSALGSVTDSSTTGVSAVSASAITQANPGVITVSSHSFQAGDKITIANCTQTDYNGDHVVASVTSTTITTETDMSAFGTGAASDGDVTLNMVRFELAEELPYFSIWILTETGASTSGGAVLEAASGCQISSFSTEVSKNGELKYTFGGDFYRQYYGGTAELSATAANAGTTLTFDSASYDVDNLFFVGQYVNIIDPAESATLDSAVEVTAVNSTANTLTVAALSVTNGPLPVGSIVKPYLPTGTISGDVLAQRTAQVYLGTADTDYGHASGDLIESTYSLAAKMGTVSLSQTLSKPHEKELTGDEYPTASFIPGAREISGDVAVVFKLDNQKYYEDLKNTPRRALAYTVGSTEGSIVEFYFPKVFMRVPANSIEEEARTQTFSWETVEPSLGTEREFMLVYR